MNTINKITVSGNTYGIVDTDTKVTSAANHYTPSADNNAELTASLSGTAGAYAKDTEYTVLTGVKAQRDAKGHVTGLTYTAQKIKDTDTNTVTSINGKTGAIAASDIATVLTSAGYKLTDADTNTWRPVQCNSTDIGSNTLNLVAGSNVTLSRSNGTITINSSYTDTNTWRPISDSVSSTSSDTSASSNAVKTAYDLAASKTSNIGTVTSVVGGTGLNGGTISTTGTLSVKYGTAAGTACQGNDSRLSNARPASDVYTWAKASTKPTYIANEVMSISAVAISANTSSSCSITGSGNAGKAQTIIYTNSGSSDLTVTVPTDYTTPDGAAIELTCKAGGYCEVSYLNIGGTIYARGL